MKIVFEAVLLYLGLPAVLAFAPQWVARSFGIRVNAWVIPVLLFAGAVATLYLKTAGLLKRGEFLRLKGVTARDWRMMFLRFFACALLLTAVLALHRPDWLLSFPRRSPGFWLFVCAAYPVVSVMPQGVLYRALWEKRYARALPRTASLVLGAVFFAWAHIVFRNVWACAFTFVGGLFFLSSYRRTGSLLFSGIEHALYGDFIFTIGWGAFFYEGTQAAIRSAASLP